MPRIAAAGSRLRTRACARAIVACTAFGALLLVLLAPEVCRAEPIKGEATLAASAGYARLIVKLDEDIGSEVSVAGAIVVIRFKRPVDIAIDKLSVTAPDYVGTARLDPDGTALRLSLNRKVTVNAMSAGERLFVDLLPDTWNGMPPGLPQEVVRELADRARLAERALRQQRLVVETKKRPPVRVRASVQPTFVRFVFELPDGSGVSSALDDQRLALSFNAPLTFDLADAKLAAPPNIAGITQKIEGDAAIVAMNFIGDVNVHSFREEKSYIIDVAFDQSERLPQVPAAIAQAKPETKLAKLATETQAAQKSDEIVPPTSETIARQASLDPKSEADIKAKAGEKPEPVTASPMPTPAAPPAVTVAAPPPSPAKEKSATAAEPPAIAAPSAVAVPSAAEPARADKADENPGVVAAKRSSEGLSLTFSFTAATPAALFRRADVVWLFFDSKKAVDLDAIRKEAGAALAEVTAIPLDKGQALRFRLNRPQLASLTRSGQAGSQNWVVTFADSMKTASQPLTAIRNIADPKLANVTVPIAGPGLMHRLVDPDAGDMLMVVTAPLPARGFVKRQDFVEFSLLELVHGVVIQSNSDDVAVEIAPDKITLSRPGGLTLSSVSVAPDRATSAVRQIFDADEWRLNQQHDFIKRLDSLIIAAGSASGDQQTPARINLARFYMSRGMYPEAKGVLDLVLTDVKPGQEDPVALIVHAVASMLSGRPAQGLKDLTSAAIGTNYDSQLWQALALARQGKWADAREKFKNVEFAIASQPVELQRIILADAMRASLEVKDYSGAGTRSDDLDVIGILADQKPAIAVMRGRLAEALGRDQDALVQYQSAVASPDRPSAAEAKLLATALRQRRNEITQDDALRDLETMSMTWRGDGLEVKALEMLAGIYADAGRFSESLGAARTATMLQPELRAVAPGPGRRCGFVCAAIP